jgi:hypothetical protein
LAGSRVAVSLWEVLPWKVANTDQPFEQTKAENAEIILTKYRGRESEPCLLEGKDGLGVGRVPGKARSFLLYVGW